MEFFRIRNLLNDKIYTETNQFLNSDRRPNRILSPTSLNGDQTPSTSKVSLITIFSRTNLYIQFLDR